MGSHGLMRTLTRHELYEICVQSPEDLVPLLRAIHGGEPRTLGEDFAGSGALSRLWVGSVECGSAIAVDHDAETLALAKADGVRTIVGDVRSATTAADAADIIFVGNFSIGELHERGELVAYLRHCRERLTPGGVFVCDIYGGDSAFLAGHVHRPHPGPEGTTIRYTWEQRKADPMTGMVTNALHFRVEQAGTIYQEEHDAFVYHWRLWSVPELRDAMTEAGFGTTETYAKLADAIDDEGNAHVLPIEDGGEDLDESFIVCVTARV